MKNKKTYPKKTFEQTIFKKQEKKNWSEYQKNIFRNIAKDTGHTLVIARAGSAKTTTLVEGAKYIPKGKKSLFVAFNKSIQEELKAKLPSYVECLTLHSLGLRGIKAKFQNVEINNYKCQNMIEKFIENNKENYPLIDSIKKTVSLCKANLADTPKLIEDIIDKYDIDLEDTPLETFIHYVSKTLRSCKEFTKEVDFDDMIWFPLIFRINVGKYDFVGIDECQDLNRAQIELALSACKIDGRVLALMDNFQAIYSWRGADSLVYDNLKNRLEPKEYKLPICYRCPKKVVTLCKNYVEDIIHFEESKDGEIIDLPLNDMIKKASKGDYIISRFNAPLIKNCMNFLKNRIPANILGRDIGENLSNMLKKSKKKDIKTFLEWLKKWEKDEKENLLLKYPNASTDNIADKAECLRILCEDSFSLDDVKSNINKLFQENEESKIVLFSSIHKIKGKETNNVFVLTDTLSESSQEEKNLCYVAFSRAKSKLYLVKKSSDSLSFLDRYRDEDIYKEDYI